VVAGLQVVVPRPAGAAPSASSAPGAAGVVIVRVESGLDSGWFKAVEASCPAGTVLYGGGGRISGGSGLVDLLQLLPGDPAAGDHVFRVAAIEGLPFAPRWRLHAAAVCGPPLAGIERVVSPASVLPASAVGTGAHAVCPAGKVVLSTGGLATSPAEAPLHWIRPMGNGTEVFAVVHRDDRVVPTTLASVGAVAICAPAPPGHEIVATGTQPTPQGLKVVNAWCPAGKVAVGGALTMFDPGGRGHHHFAGFVPEDGTDRSFRTEAEGPGGEDWALGSWAICIAA